MPNAPILTVLGFRPHTYWTAVVALTGPPDAPRVFARQRIEFAAGEERFVYHRAAGVERARAASLVAQVGEATQANAAREIGRLIAVLGREGLRVSMAVVPTGTARIPDKLEDILGAHSRIHAAEGVFYRDVVARSCEAAGLATRRAVERELPALACDALDLDPISLEVRLKQMGADLGPPWSEDFKLATLAAWLHLKTAAAISAP